MGYIGLLLNAPYKIDSMVWMRLMMTLVFLLVLSCFFCCLWAIGTRGVFGEGRP
jgi:hypothetical protein